ncbi:replicative DNA helicase [Patescibacteria group bacterium]|nr:replicative DNA helicase [Patescibacteria group bacterium]
MPIKNKETELRLPPQNIEAEQSVLGALLLDKEAIFKVADIITSADFYRDNHRMIYEAMGRLFEKRIPIDVLTLTEELERDKKIKMIGGASYLATLANAVPSAAHVVHYAQIVANKATLRRLISSASETIELGYEEREPVELILDRAEKSLFSVSKGHSANKFITLRDALEESFERIDRLHKEKGTLRGVPTGFKDLDNLLSGMQKSDLIILAARPSMGKSSLALNIAANAALKSKIPVGLFSLEMSKDQLVDRLIISEARIDSWKMRTGNLAEDDFGRIGQAMGSLSEAPIFIEDSPNLSIMEVRTKARRLRAEHNIGLLVVDYLQLMEGRFSNSNDSNRVQEISEISRGLKALARELDLPVLALSQLSRAVEHREHKIPQLSDLRESGAIEQDSDVVIFIYRDDYYDRGSEKKNIADILIKKHRNGPIGEVELFFAESEMTFRNLEKKRDQDELIDSESVFEKEKVIQ